MESSLQIKRVFRYFIKTYLMAKSLKAKIVTVNWFLQENI